MNVQVHIEFTEEQDQIRLEGPPDDVEHATKLLQDIVNDLVQCHYYVQLYFAKRQQRKQ